MCVQTINWSMYTFSNVGRNFCCVSCSFGHASTQVCVCGAEMSALQFNKEKREHFRFIFISCVITCLFRAWMYILVDLGCS